MGTAKHRVPGNDEQTEQGKLQQGIAGGSVGVLLVETPRQRRGPQLGTPRDGKRGARNARVKIPHAPIPQEEEDPRHDPRRSEVPKVALSDVDPGATSKAFLGAGIQEGRGATATNFQNIVELDEDAVG